MLSSRSESRHPLPQQGTAPGFVSEPVQRVRLLATRYVKCDAARPFATSGCAVLKWFCLMRPGLQRSKHCNRQHRAHLQRDNDQCQPQHDVQARLHVCERVQWLRRWLLPDRWHPPRQQLLCASQTLMGPVILVLLPPQPVLASRLCPSDLLISPCLRPVASSKCASGLPSPRLLSRAVCSVLMLHGVHVMCSRLAVLRPAARR